MVFRLSACSFKLLAHFVSQNGRLAEWSKAHRWKRCVLQGTASSNLVPSEFTLLYLLMMEVILKELSLDDGEECHQMLQEIWPWENWFENSWYDMDFDEYLSKYYNQSKWNNLPEWYVPQTIYWLYIDKNLVWYGKLRHFLTEKLLEEWGHIWYCIRPSERGKGYWNIILKELLKKTKEKNIEKALLTCDPENTPSKKIIELNGGILENIKTKCRYWIEL